MVNCTECAADYSLQTNAITQLSLCVSNCSDGYYKSANCLPCSAGCKTCKISQSCISCLETKFYFYETPTILKCLDSCPQGTYLGSSRTCVKCHTACSSCNGPLIDNCTACQDTTLLVSNKCSKTAGCPSGCSACNSSSACLACDGGNYFQAGTCVALCANNFYQLGGACLPCHPYCQLCFGSAQS